MSEPIVPFRVRARQVSHDTSPAGVQRRLLTLLSGALLVVLTLAALLGAGQLALMHAPTPVPGETLPVFSAPLSSPAPPPTGADSQELSPPPDASDNLLPAERDATLAAVTAERCPADPLAPCPDGRGMGPFLPDGPDFWFDLIAGVLFWAAVNAGLWLLACAALLLLLIPVAPVHWVRRGQLVSERLPWRLWSPRLLISLPAPGVNGRSALLAGLFTLGVVICSARVASSALEVCLLLFGVQRWAGVGLLWCAQQLQPYTYALAEFCSELEGRFFEWRWKRSTARERHQHGQHD